MNIKPANPVILLLVAVALACVSALLPGCATQLRVEPIQPYVDPGIRSYDIRTVAVVPFVIPDYVGQASGGNQVSVRLTNEMIRHLNEMNTYHIINPETVGKVLQDRVGPITEWIFTGTREEALTVAEEIQCEGVLYSRVTSYRQGNLIDSEVEIETSLIDTFSATTVWSIRENVRGKAGRESLNQPVRAPSAEELAEVALKNVARKIQMVNRDGEDVQVSYVSPRRVAGFTLLGVGAASTAVTGYTFYEAERSYAAYRNEDDGGKTQDLKERTQDYDTMTWVFGGLSVAALGTAAYLLLTDNPYSFTAGLPIEEQRVQLSPVWLPGGGAVVLQVRF